ncbi:prolyl oligopeptidase family serine peptidase [Tomitella cavernea]|uniref:Prolyl oligopeptidase family serine peptidase n=1 Tax=Tomitella cavernea TaxID=1387982 RepID=A0ABP9CVZ2_9ACTN|nr:prolyl oligopeptidase family serine peptidase [Tomitella cavernea]
MDTTASTPAHAPEPADPHLWLEDVDGEKQLAWVRERNAVTAARFTETERFAATRDRLRGILDTDSRIAFPRRRGEYLYNFWRDAQHVRGIWRRTTLESYRSDAPEWDVIIDLDALADAEGENWMWAGTSVLRVWDPQDPDARPDHPRALVSLSRGGADAVVVREFDMATREFIAPEQGGFTLAEAKSELSWIDADTVYVGTDVGEESLTDSGYPRTARLWRRGTAVEDAPVVFEGTRQDVAVSVFYDDTPGYERHLAERALDFYTTERYLLAPGAEPEPLDVPGDSEVSLHRGWLFVFLRSGWAVGGAEYSPGTLLRADLAAYRRGGRAMTVLFQPEAHRSLENFTVTRHHLLLTVLEDVRTRLVVLDLERPDPAAARAIDGVPADATVSVIGTDADFTDEVFVVSTGFLQPATLLHGQVDTGVAPLKSAPGFFDAAGLAVDQHFAVSDDGTRIPYFVVAPRAGARAEPGAERTPAPTLLYGYGGFENALTPGYSGLTGAGWLERGGVYVVANIRGGGEYGPQWHTQAVKAGRHRVYEDFAAVARDLVARGITTPSLLGAQGGSNGGLLMGVMLTAYPELFGALVCQVPLLDMRRYHRLLAGASWMAEYGDPDDPAEWDYISRYSPYQNTDPAADYPPVLLTTSTRDDRVHPGHARKMAATLAEQGHPVWYYENIEGGHGGAADNAQHAFKAALAYEFLWTTLRGDRRGDAAPADGESAG